MAQPDPLVSAVNFFLYGPPKQRTIKASKRAAAVAAISVALNDLSVDDGTTATWMDTLTPEAAITITDCMCKLRRDGTEINDALLVALTLHAKRQHNLGGWQDGLGAEERAAIIARLGAGKTVGVVGAPSVSVVTAFIAYYAGQLSRVAVGTTNAVAGSASAVTQQVLAHEQENQAAYLMLPWDKAAPATAAATNQDLYAWTTTYDQKLAHVLAVAKDDPEVVAFFTAFYASHYDAVDVAAVDTALEDEALEDAAPEDASAWNTNCLALAVPLTGKGPPRIPSDGN